MIVRALPARQKVAIRDWNCRRTLRSWRALRASNLPARCFFCEFWRRVIARNMENERNLFFLISPAQKSKSAPGVSCDRLEKNSITSDPDAMNKWLLTLKPIIVLWWRYSEQMKLSALHSHNGNIFELLARQSAVARDVWASVARCVTSPRMVNICHASVMWRVAVATFRVFSSFCTREALYAALTRKKNDCLHFGPLEEKKWLFAFSALTVFSFTQENFSKRSHVR